jgi:hypothetical protein
MKQIIVKTIRPVTVLVFAILFAACDRSYEPVFGEDPDDRLRESLRQYDATLQEAPFGWKAVLETGAGVNYFYYFNFHDNGTVTMVSDFNTTTAGVAGSGTWKLKGLQRPTLSFDTYSYIHLPADPDGNVNGGTNGQGLVSDFEFAFARTTNDTLYLDGIQHGAHITFVKATGPEATALQQGVMQNMLQYMLTSTGLRIPVDGNTVTLAFDLATRSMAAQSLSANGREVEVHRATYTFTTEGVSLTTPLTLYGKTITGFLWNEERGTYTAAGTLSAEVESVDGLYLFEPSVPLYTVIGKTYSTVQIPQGSGDAPLPGQSNDFIQGYKEVAASLWEGQYRLALNEMNFVFYPADNTMLLDVYVTQGTTRFLCEFNYTYTIDETGTIKFVFNTANDNAWVIYSTLYGALLRYLEEDTFRAAYVGGGYDLTAGFFSQESTLFSFSGYLLK